MSSNQAPFIDASFAAELLGVQTADILDLIASGKLARLGGKDRNPFVRTSQVEALAKELGKGLEEPPVKRRASQNPVRRVELRLRHDTRWNEVTDADLAAWARSLDESGRRAAKQVAERTSERLRCALVALEASDASDQST